MKMKLLHLAPLVIFLLACGLSSEQLTATAVAAQAQTQTAEPTQTSSPTATPTSTPKPTRTPLPTETPQPTPAAVGETVRLGSLEITLLEVATHSHIVPAGRYYWYSEAGMIFVDMTVLVRNTSDIPVNMALKHIYILEESDERWYPNFCSWETVEIDKKFNAMWNLEIKEVSSGDQNVTLKKDTYLRLIWYTHDNQNLQFGILDWPTFVIPVNKK